MIKFYHGEKTGNLHVLIFFELEQILGLTDAPHGIETNAEKPDEYRMENQISSCSMSDSSGDNVQLATNCEPLPKDICVTCGHLRNSHKKIGRSPEIFCHNPIWEKNQKAYINCPCKKFKEKGK